VVASEEDRGHFETIINSGSSVLRKGEQLAVVAIPSQGVFLTKYPGNLPTDTIDHNTGRKGAIG
jgi:hypothetical protein